MLVASLMDDSERFLSTYQHFNAITLASDSNSSNSSDDPYKKIPKLLSSRLKRFKHEKCVDDFFEKYLQERFSPKDYRLMNCVRTTKELTNEQLAEFEISKADSHISIQDEVEKKLDQNSDSEEHKKKDIDLNKGYEKASDKAKNDLSFKNIHNLIAKSKSTVTKISKTKRKDDKRKSNEDEVESLSMINELELPRISIGTKNSKNEFAQIKQAE